jgi:hypothetical protein
MRIRIRIRIKMRSQIWIGIKTMPACNTGTCDIVQSKCLMFSQILFEVEVGYLRGGAPHWAAVPTRVRLEEGHTDSDQTRSPTPS